MKALETRIPPPLVAFVVAGLMLQAPSWPIHLVGRPLLMLVSFSLAGFFAFPAVVWFWRARTTVNPIQVGGASKLVTGGPYRFSRNPMYVALVLLALTWGLFLSTTSLFWGPLLLGAYLTRFQIIPEERALREIFGEDYLAYCRRVRRWL